MHLKLLSHQQYPTNLYYSACASYVVKMSSLDDDGDNFVHINLSDSNSDSECDSDFGEAQALSTTPTSPRKPRPSDLKSISCPIQDCEKTFNRQARLDEHLNSHNNTRVYKCSYNDCGKDFLRETHLKRHIKSAHTEVRDYKCSWEDCDKSFSTGTRLRRHEAAHEKKDMFRCRGYDGCNKTFRKHTTLNNHVLQEHMHQKPFSCAEVDLKTGQICKSKFETAEKLRSHQRTKHDETRFSCETCRLPPAPGLSEALIANLDDDGMTTIFFSTFAELQQHISIVHPPTCEMCSNVFISNKELKTHQELVHDVLDSEKRPSATFLCEEAECGRIFSKRGNLTVHVKTVHENTKDFVCGETEINVLELIGSHGTIGVNGNLEIEGCGQAFTSKASLQEHVRTAHLGLGSKRAERNRKRNEKQMLAEEEMRELPQMKKRMSRKGQGKKSALSALTGAPRDFELLTPAYTAPSYDEHEEKETGSSYFGQEEEEDQDEDVSEGGLTGLETIYEGRLYGQDLTWSTHLSYHPLGDGGRTYAGFGERDLTKYGGNDSSRDGGGRGGGFGYGSSAAARIQQILGHANHNTSSSGNFYLGADHIPATIDPQLV